MESELQKRFSQVDLYPVTCELLSAGRTNREVLEGILAGGAKIVQLRDKERKGEELEEEARWFRRMTQEAGVLLVINDDVELAVRVGADGVHLGQQDMPLAEARRIAQDLILGASTHNPEEIRKAQEEGADYINIGPVFPTKTKSGWEEFVGPERMTAWSAGLAVPFSVMGGINLENIDRVLPARPQGIAVVTAITKASDIAAAVRELRTMILQYRRIHGKAKQDGT